MGKGKAGASSRATGKPHRPTPRERRSAGAAMATPKKLAIEVNPSGGSEAFVVPKPLRGGERVLSTPVKRYQGLLPEKEKQQANHAAATDANAAAAAVAGLLHNA